MWQWPIWFLWECVRLVDWKLYLTEGKGIPCGLVFLTQTALTDIKLGSTVHGRCARILFSCWRLWSLKGTCLGRRPSVDVSHRRSPPCRRNSVRCIHTRLEHFIWSAACNYTLRLTSLLRYWRKWTKAPSFGNPAVNEERIRPIERHQYQWPWVILKIAFTAWNLSNSDSSGNVQYVYTWISKCVWLVISNVLSKVDFQGHSLSHLYIIIHRWII